MSGLKNRHLRLLWRAAWQVALVLLVLEGVQWLQSRDTVSGPAPAFAAADLDGRELRLADYAGRPVLVHFWATWCPVCRLEEDNIDAVAADHPVLTIAIDTAQTATVRSYVRDNDLDFRVVHDPSGELARRYGVQGVPTSFVLDADGVVRFTEVGYTTEIGLRIRLALAKWLYGPDE